MHDPVLAGWCMVVTTKSMVETTQKQPSNRFKNTVNCCQVAACLEQPTDICLGTTMFLACNMVGISIWVRYNLAQEHHVHHMEPILCHTLCMMHRCQLLR